jgi:hypothetical protein
MKKKESPKRDFTGNMINHAVLTHWWSLVQAVESIRNNRDDRLAIFNLGTSIQGLICLSLEYGTHRLLKALPSEQRHRLETIITDGTELARDSLEDGTALFEGMDFPSADSIFQLISGISLHRRDI